MKKLFLLILSLLTLPLYAQQYSEQDIANRHTVPFPVQRLQQDWIYQDSGTRLPSPVFVSDQNADLEAKMVRKVLDELKAGGADTAQGEAGLKALLDAKKPANDPAWKDLYFSLCSQRRVQRLAYFKDQPRDYIYAKHFVFGDAQAMFAMTDHLTDAIFRECGRDVRMGSQLCRMRINEDGTVKTVVILDCPTGIVRDPCLSYDGKTLVFSMRKADHDHGDDFHLYKMDLSGTTAETPLQNMKDEAGNDLPIRSVAPIKQITFGPGVADMEPEWLPDGNLIFTSTRCNISAPCWWSSVCNLFTCDAEGRYIHRLAVDHGHTVFPHVTNDGRITYTRWEYSDRNAGYLHTLFVMNADGTNQTEFYGNNSQYPAAVLHGRMIPNSTKVMAIAGAHHIDQRGKLIMIDRSEGMQAGEGVYFLAPKRPMPNLENTGHETTGGNVVHGTEGEQFQYPYPLDEENLLVCYSPEGGPVRGLKGIGKDGKPGSPAFGIYWMNVDGRRELLIYDPVISVGQHIAEKARPLPPQKISPVNESLNSGFFYVQNVYFGPGLEGVPKGTVKKMRIVGLDYRVKGTVALGLHPWGGHQTSPCGINNSAYDVRHVLGEVDVEEDGSCYFECPSRVPVFFQMLDEKGQMVQNMRSWTMVLPGEQFFCIGCHEDKNNTFIDNKQITAALRKPPQKIQPFFAPGDEPVQEMERFLTDHQKRAMAYLNVEAPQGMDVPKGFSYTREIQPIWDAHCIQCHNGGKDPAKKDVPLNLMGDTRPYTMQDIYSRAKWRTCMRPYGKVTQGNPGRYFSESYLALTDFGYNAKILHGVWADATRDPAYLSFFGGDPKNIPNPGAGGYSADEYNGKGIINWAHASGACGMVKPYSFGSSSSPLMKYLEPSHYGVQLTDAEKRLVACWIDLNVPFCGSWMEQNCWDKLNHARDSGLTPWYVYRDQMRQIYLYFEAKRLAQAELEIDAIDKLIEHQTTGKEFAPSDFPASPLGGQEAQAKFVADQDALVGKVPIFGMAEGRNARGGSNVVGNPVRNLAVNPDAYTYWLRSFPRTSSNSHYMYKPEYSPICVIDGKTDGTSYWRPARRTDLWLRVSFGREIVTEKIVITLKLTEGQQKTWTKGVLHFSTGEEVPIELKCTSEPQVFTFPAKTCAWVTLTKLEETFPLVDNGISEIEVWGKDKE
ncbi:MAG: hypothetical protein Q4A17_13950 [Thermoguttaceae bacterium]|nr:hypothetical protein [Thermoguttaceae bacterium]